MENSFSFIKTFVFVVPPLTDVIAHCEVWPSPSCLFLRGSDRATQWLLVLKTRVVIHTGNGLMGRALRVFHGILGESELNFPLCVTGLITMNSELWGKRATSVFLIAQSPFTPHRQVPHHVLLTHKFSCFQQACLFLVLMDTKPGCIQAPFFSKWPTNLWIFFFLFQLLFPSSYT